MSRLRAQVEKFTVDLYLVLVDSYSIFIRVFNNLISVLVFILPRVLELRGMLHVKRAIIITELYYFDSVSCV